MPQVNVTQYLLLIFTPFCQVTIGILLLVVPGWSLASRLKFDPLTKLLVATVASCTLMYLLALGAYVASIPQWIAFVVVITVATGSVIDTLRRRSIRPEPLPLGGLLTWLSLTIWILAMQSRVVTYGSGDWFGDWHEHYERAIFFLDHEPANTRFLKDMWAVPARAPMFNAVAALLMAAFGRDFADYQSVATLLNTFWLLPMALLMRDIGQRTERTALFWSVVVLGIAPFAVQQETFTWTKAFTCAFILGGIHLYRLGLAENRPWVAGGSFLLFTAGILAHYLAIIFIVFFAIHVLYVAIQRRWQWQAIVYPAAACTVLIATWGIYLLPTFGFQATVTANSTVIGYDIFPVPYRAHASRFLSNLITTTIPYSWRLGWEGRGKARRIVQRDPRFSPTLGPTNAELNTRTEWFSTLANNPSSLFGMLGIAGMIGVGTAAVRAIRRPKQKWPILMARGDAAAAGPGWKFWLIFFAIGIPLNILASADYEPIGLAHINLQPYALLTAVLLFRMLGDLSKWCSGALVAVFLVESALISGAIMHLQARRVPMILSAQPVEAERTLPSFPSWEASSDPAQDGHVMLTAKLGLNETYVDNYILKLNTRAVFMSDRLGDLTGPFALIAVVISMGLLIVGACSGSAPIKSDP